MAATVLAVTAMWAAPGYIELAIPVVKHLGGGAFGMSGNMPNFHSEDVALVTANSSLLYRLGKGFD